MLSHKCNGVYLKWNILVCVLLLLLSFCKTAHTQSHRTENPLKTMRYEKGIVIVQYEPIAASRMHLTVERLRDEHTAFIVQLAQYFPLEIHAHRPVFQTLIAQMEQENRTERELQQAVYERRNPDQVTLESSIPFYNFSRVLALTVDDRQDLPQLVERWNQQVSEWDLSGYRITDFSLNPLYEVASTSEGKLALSSNDELFLQQFSHQITGAATAWEVERGRAGIIIAIIDSGVFGAHEDLTGKVTPGFDFVNRPNLSDWQKIPGEDYIEIDNDPTDADGHGTHVAGIAAAQGENGIGISGVCPECSIMPLRTIVNIKEVEENNGQEDTVITSSGSVAESAEAVIWATDNGADVINMSFAGQGAWRNPFRNALRYAHNNGVVLIASAANDTTSERRYPAAHEEVIAVASTSLEDRKSFFSNYGDWVDVSAPGEAMLSTVPEELGYIPETVIRFTVGQDPISAFPLTFSGQTTTGEVVGSLAHVGMARSQDISNEAFDWELENKIALIERGEISFEEKVTRVKSFGAIGAIIYNNETGNFRGTLGSSQQDPIPVFSIAREDGLHLIDQITSTSQPVLGSLLQTTFPNYTRLSGTSFSSPYVAGMAGLLLSHDPSLSPDEVRERLLSSVDNIDALNPQYAGQLGSGRVNLRKLFPQLTTSLAPSVLDENISIFPNPTSGQLNLETSTPGPLSQLTIFNVIGQSFPVELTYNKNLPSANLTRLDVSHLSAGWYVISGYMDKKRWVKRFYKYD